MKSAITNQPFDSLDASADADSDPINVLDVHMGSVHVVWDSLGANDAVLKVQGSNDKSNWDDIASASVTMNPGSGANDLLRLSSIEYEWIRLVYTKNTVAAGTVDAHCVFKSNQ